jgi:two-component system chemotaxis response regulator CheY
MESHNRESEPVHRAEGSDSTTLERPDARGPNRRGRILIVEDEEQVRKPIRLNLVKAGYDVIEVAEGNAGTVDTILCDIRMPAVTGVEAILYVRAHYPSIPIVVLTGYPDVELAASLMKQGVLDYLVKPITREELLTVIERCVGQCQAAR